MLCCTKRTRGVSLAVTMLMALTPWALGALPSTPAPLEALSDEGVAPPRMKAVAPRVDEARLVWHTETEAAFVEAMEHYKSVLILVTSPQCGYCHALKSLLHGDAEIRALLRRFALVELDAAADPIGARRLAVQGVPTLVVLAADGRERQRLGGFPGREPLLGFLRGLLGETAVPETGVETLLTDFSAGNLAASDWPALLRAMAQPGVRETLREGFRAQGAVPVPDLLPMLGHSALAVRMGAIELLEETAGSLFGYDPWMAPEAVGNRDALAEWDRWGNAAETNRTAMYSSLTAARIEAYLRDLVGEHRERSTRAARMLRQGDAGVAASLREHLDNSPGMPEGLRRRVREVLYAIELPQSPSEDRADWATRLVSGNPDMRLRALRRLGGTGRAGWRILRDYLADPDALVRETAVDALAASRDPGALPILRQHVGGEEDINVIIAAVRGFGLIRSRRALALLTALAGHEHEDVVIEALRSMARLRSRQCADAVSDALSDPRWRVRVAALETVAGLKLADLADKVRGMASDPDRFVRFHVIKTLSVIAGKDAVDVLTQQYLAEDDLKAPIITALGSLDAPLPEAIMASVSATPDETLVGVALALEACDARGITMLETLARHANADVACAALRALARSRHRTAASDRVLMEALASGERAKVLSVLQDLNVPGQTSSYDSFGFDALLLDIESQIVSAAEDGDDSATADPSDAAALSSLFDAFAGTKPEPEPTPPAAAPSLGDLFSAFDEAPEPTQARDDAPRQPAAGGLVGAIRPHLDQESDTEVRQVAAEALLSYRSLEALTYLEGRMHRMTISQRRDLAAKLKGFQHDAALRVLTALLRDENSAVRVVAANALREGVAKAAWANALFGDLLREGSHLTPEELFGGGFRGSSSSAHRLRLREASDTFMAATNREDVVTLGLLLRDSVWGPGDAALVEPLLTAESPWVRREAWRVFGKHEHTKFEDRVGELVSDASEYVRIVAPSLARRGGGAWLTYYGLDSTSRTYDYSSHASRHARRLSDAMREALVRLTDDPAPRVRIEAAIALMSRNESIDVAKLMTTLSMVDDPTPLRRRIGSYVEDNYRRLGPDYAALLPFLTGAGIEEETLEKIRRHFHGDSEDAGAMDAERTVMRTADNEESVAPVTEPVAASEPERVRFAFFVERGCGDCTEVEQWLAILADVYPSLDIDTHDIGKLAARDLNERLCERFGIGPDQWSLTPAVFGAGGGLVRTDITFESLGQLLALSVGQSDSDWLPPEVQPDKTRATVAEPATATEPESEGKKTTHPAVLVVAVLFLLLTAMLLYTYRRKPGSLS